MRTLYLDTSSSWLYTGIVEDEILIDCVKEKLDKDLSSFSLPKIVEMLEKNDIDKSSIDRMIVVTGPGSFTGIRIGLTIAKTWAWAKQIEIIPISSLEAMALSGKAAAYFIPMIDARRNYYYAGIYDKKGNVVWNDRHILLSEFHKELENYSDCKIISQEEVPLSLPRENYDPDILRIVTQVASRPSVNAHSLEPNYLKQTEAEEKLEAHDCNNK